jgi:hypothetical protein
MNFYHEIEGECTKIHQWALKGLKMPFLVTPCRTIIFQDLFVINLNDLCHKSNRNNCIAVIDTIPNIR